MNQPLSFSAWQSFQSDDRQALPALEATGADDFASARGGHTGAITDLAGAFFTVWAECWLHDFCRKRGSEVSDAVGGVKGGVLSGRFHAVVSTGVSKSSEGRFGAGEVSTASDSGGAGPARSDFGVVRRTWTTRRHDRRVAPAGDFREGNPHCWLESHQQSVGVPLPALPDWGSWHRCARRFAGHLEPAGARVWLAAQVAGEVFTAPVPAAAGPERYVPSVGVTIAVFVSASGFRITGCSATSSACAYCCQL